MSDAAKVERREVYYSGRVQGVGFRYTVRMIAAGLDVAGFVKNLADGRVEMVAEGTAEELRRLFDAIDAQMGRYISDANVRTRDATGRFEGFVIRW